MSPSAQAFVELLLASCLLISHQLNKSQGSAKSLWERTTQGTDIERNDSLESYGKE